MSLLHLFTPHHSGITLYDSYDESLVLLSVIISCLGVYATLGIADRIRALDDNPLTEKIWLSAGALTMGTGVWAMHFIGMLAFTLKTADNAPIIVLYDLVTTLCSVVPAILAGVVVLNIASRRTVSQKRLLFYGVLMGAGIGMMHYIGMMAMQSDKELIMLIDMTGFIISVVVAAMLGITSLYANKVLSTDKYTRTKWAKIVSAITMGFAGAAMHYICLLYTSDAADE